MKIPLCKTYKHCDDIREYRVTQGCSMAITLEISIFDLLLVMPKCVSAVVDYYQLSAVWIQFSALCLQFLKKYATHKTHFGLDNLWSRMHNQKGIAT